ncbi:pleiotropic drug resistance protein 3 [Fagus crenata]
MSKPTDEHKLRDGEGFEHEKIEERRITLLLGPPGCRKTSLLKALSGNLNQSLKGRVGIVRTTVAFIEEQDFYSTVSPVGVGSQLAWWYLEALFVSWPNEDVMVEVSKREKEAGIVPDPDIDTYMKVISRKDQARYWCHMEVPYSYVSVDMFSRKFKESRYEKKLDEKLSEPYDKSQSHKDALSFSL